MYIILLSFVKEPYLFTELFFLFIPKTYNGRHLWCFFVLLKHTSQYQRVLSLIITFRNGVFKRFYLFIAQRNNIEVVGLTLNFVIIVISFIHLFMTETIFVLFLLSFFISFFFLFCCCWFNLIKHRSFVYTQLKDQTVLFLTSQLNIRQQS